MHYTSNEIFLRRYVLLSKSMNTPRCKGVDIFLRVNILMPDNLDSSLQVGNTCR